MRVTDATCPQPHPPEAGLDGPLIGLALTGFDFRLTCLVAGGVFADRDAGAPLVLSAVLLSLGTIVVFPFEMDTIVTLSSGYST